MKDGVHGRPQSPPVSVQDLREEDLRQERIAQHQSPHDQTGTVHRRGEEAEAQEENRGVDEERFLPPDGVTEEASKAGGHKVTQHPARG